MAINTQHPSEQQEETSSAPVEKTQQAEMNSIQENGTSDVRKKDVQEKKVQDTKTQENRELFSPSGNDEKEPSYTYSHKFIYLFLGVFVLIVGVVATLLCRAQVRYAEQELKIQTSNFEQTWGDTTLEDIRNWRTKILEPIHYISQAEMFRLFVKDVWESVGSTPSRLDDPAVAGDDTHELHSLVEERSYLRDLLQDSVTRRGWLHARLLDQEGNDLLADENVQLREEQKECVQHAMKSHESTFSRIYHGQSGIAMDVIDPLTEVLSAGDPKIVGYLVVTVPMEGALANFLSESRLQDANYTPYILSQSSAGSVLVAMRDKRAAIIRDGIPPVEAQLAFEERDSYDASSQRVWSIGERLSDLNWVLILEKDSGILEEEIFNEAREIYGLGVLGSLAIALVVAIVVGTIVVRHRAREGQKCIGGLVHAIECALDGQDPKFKYLQGRSHKVTILSARLGKILKLSSEAMENMQLAARLSQVGKIFVPREIMIKRGLLTEEERRQVQLAPYHAYNVLKGVLPKRVARVVYQMGGKVVDDPETGANHELRTSEMLFEARVLLVANDFCAMVSQRGNRPPLPIADARQKLVQRELYDRSVVAAVNTIPDEEIRELLRLQTPGDGGDAASGPDSRGGAEDASGRTERPAAERPAQPDAPVQG